MASKIVLGEKVQLWVKDKSGATPTCLAMATSLSVEISADATDISSKDSGRWASSLLGKISWTASASNLFTVADYSKLIDVMVANTPIEIVFATVKNYDTVTSGATDSEGMFTDTPTVWESNDDMYHGKVVVNSISLSANNGEVATYDVSFTGVGALQKGGISKV
jgi:predicted secreted protein